MDTKKSSATIFKELAERFGGQKLNQLSEIKKLLSELLHQTDGWVILDFLDTANWDRIEAFQLDDNGLLTLIWHDFRTTEEPEIEKEMRQMVFPASLYSLGISVNSIVPIIGEKTAVFLINGYAKTEKEIKKIYKEGSSEYKIYSNSFFEKRIIRKVSTHWEEIQFHCTPIYSLAIIPKKSGISSFDWTYARTIRTDGERSCWRR